MIDFSQKKISTYIKPSYECFRNISLLKKFCGIELIFIFFFCVF